MLITDQPIYQRIYAYVQQHNEAQQLPAHRITKNRYAMLRAITELSITEARRVVRLPQWADSDTLPTVYTRRAELARLVGCGPRTVYNCIDVLERAGLVKKTLHGRQNDFELTLHPWFIFEASYEAPQVRRLGAVDKSGEGVGAQNLAAQNQPLSPDRRQNLPPISSSEAKETVLISSNSGVDCGKPRLGPTFGAPPHNPRVVDDKRIDKRTDAGPQSPENHPPRQPPVTIKESLGAESHLRTHQLLSIGQLLPPSPTDAGSAGESTARLTNAPSPASHSAPTAHTLQQSPHSLAMQLTAKFWQLAKEQLWPNDYITEGSDYERRLLNLVWTDVMGGFRGCTTTSEVTTRYFLRESQLKLATTYAHKHAWTSFLPPPLYFSLSQFNKEKLSNARGSFHWTYQWVKATDTAKKERQRQEQLQRAVHSVIAQVPPRTLKNGRSMSQIQLYQYWHHRLAQLRDARLLDTFDEQVIQHLPVSSSTLTSFL